MSSWKQIEKIRDAILKNAQETIWEHQKGLTKRGTAEDLIRDMEMVGDVYNGKSQ